MAIQRQVLSFGWRSRNRVRFRACQEDWAAAISHGESPSSHVAAGLPGPVTDGPAKINLARS
eukprot:574937-Hanusia_phi.AAC.1